MTCGACEARRQPLHYAIGETGAVDVRRQARGPVLPEPDIVAPAALAVELVDDDGFLLVDGTELMHQLGGEPFWLDEDAAAPSCTSCGVAMRFFGQIDSDPEIGLRFGDSGMLYAFDCADCGEFATFIQTF